MDYYFPILTRMPGIRKPPIDCSCLSVGTRTGYKIYTCDPFGKCYGKSKNTDFIQGSGGIGIAEMLFCTSLIALVGAGEHPSFSPRKLQIINTKVILFD